MKLAKSKKGQIMQTLGGLGIGIATLTIVLVIAFLIIAQSQDQIVDLQGTLPNTTAYNATEQLAIATAGVPGWIPLIVIVVIGGAILGLVKLFRR